MIVPRALTRLPLALLLGCGGAAGRAHRTGDVLAAESAPEHAAERPPVEGDPLDEASARWLLATRFRAAGLRVVEDVTIEAGGALLVVDGFDPGRRVGYEYVAPEEREVELDAARRVAAHGDPRILVVDAAGAESIERAIDAFLRELVP